MHEDGLEVIEPQAVQVAFNGRGLALLPLKVRQIPSFARAARPVSGAIESLLNGKSGGIGVEQALTLLADYGEAIIEAVSIASGVARDELEESTPDQLIALAAAVIRVNADFFGRRLIPALTAAATGATPDGAGQTP